MYKNLNRQLIYTFIYYYETFTFVLATHIQKHVHIRLCICIYVQVKMESVYTYKYTYMYSHAYAIFVIHMFTHTILHMHVLIRIRIRIRIRIHIRIRIRIHIRIRIRIRIRIHVCLAHGYTHGYTHTYHSNSGRNRPRIHTCESAFTRTKKNTHRHTQPRINVHIHTISFQDGITQAERIEHVLQRIKTLRIGDRQITLETQKIPYTDDEGNVLSHTVQDAIWHSIQFIPVIDPATGKPAILVIEDDISQLEQMKLAEQELQASHVQQEQFFAAGKFAAHVYV
jgi:hypothetical protein